jgi:hypothetical protein
VPLGRERHNAAMAPLYDYFAGERAAGALAAGLGVVSLAFAIWLYKSASPFRAMIYPVALVGIAQLAIGVGLWLKTPPQVAALESGLAAQPLDARAKETERMEKVQTNFAWIKIVEIVVMVAGVAMIMAWRTSPRAVGVGMGLTIQAAVMLAFDVFAEARGAEYLGWLKGG